MGAGIIFNLSVVVPRNNKPVMDGGGIMKDRGDVRQMKRWSDRRIEKLMCVNVHGHQGAAAARRKKMMMSSSYSLDSALFFSFYILKASCRTNSALINLKLEEK